MTAPGPYGGNVYATEVERFYERYGKLIDARQAVMLARFRSQFAEQEQAPIDPPVPLDTRPSNPFGTAQGQAPSLIPTFANLFPVQPDQPQQQAVGPVPEDRKGFLQSLGDAERMNEFELIGAAEAYGIDAESAKIMPREALVGFIANKRAEASSSLDQDPLFNSINEDIARTTAGVGVAVAKGALSGLRVASEGLSNFLQYIGEPFNPAKSKAFAEFRANNAGNPEDRRTSLNLFHLEEAEQWLQRMSENVRMGLTEEAGEVVDVAGSAGYMAGQVFPGALAYKAIALSLSAATKLPATVGTLQKIGTIGSREVNLGQTVITNSFDLLSPIARAGIGGSLTAALFNAADKNAPVLPSASGIADAYQNNDGVFAAEAIAQQVLGSRVGSAAFGGLLGMATEALVTRIRPRSQFEIKEKPRSGYEEIIPESEYFVSDDGVVAPPRDGGLQLGTPRQRGTAVSLSVSSEGPIITPTGLIPVNRQIPQTAGGTAGASSSAVVGPLSIEPAANALQLTPNDNLTNTQALSGSSFEPKNYAEQAAPRILEIVPKIQQLKTLLAEEDNIFWDEYQDKQLAVIEARNMAKNASDPVDAANYKETAARLARKVNNIKKNPRVKEIENLEREVDSYDENTVAYPTTRFADGINKTGTPFARASIAKLAATMSPARAFTESIGTAVSDDYGRPILFHHGSVLPPIMPASGENPIGRPFKSTGNIFGKVGFYGSNSPVVTGGDPSNPALRGYTDSGAAKVQSMLSRAELDYEVAKRQYDDLEKQITVMQSRGVDTSNYEQVLSDRYTATQDALDNYTNFQQAASNQGQQVQSFYIASKRVINGDDKVTTGDAEKLKSEIISRFGDSVEQDLMNDAFENVSYEDLWELAFTDHFMSYGGGRFDERILGIDEITDMVSNVLGYDAILHAGGRRIGGPIRHDAVAVFNPKVIVPMTAGDDLMAEIARNMGRELTRTQQFVDSPAVADAAGNTQVTSSAIAKSALVNRPGSMHIVSGIGNPGEIMEAIANGQLGKELASFDYDFLEGAEPDTYDLIVSGNGPITPTQKAEYSKHRMMTGQRVKAISGGQVKEAVITGFGTGAKGQDVVYLSVPGKIVTTRKGDTLKAQPLTKNLIDPKSGLPNIAPMAEVPYFFEADKEFGNFVDFAEGQLAIEATQSGVSGPAPALLSDEGAWRWSDLFDTWAAINGYTDDAVVASLRTAFDSKMLNKIADQSPEFKAAVEEMQVLNDAVPEIAENLDTTLHDFAVTRGFSAMPIEGTGRWALLDDHSPLKLSFPDEGAAVEFLASYQREVPPMAVTGGVPPELANMDFGVSPKPEPLEIDSAEPSYLDEVVDSVAEEVLSSAIGGGSAPPGGVPPLGPGGPPAGQPQLPPPGPGGRALVDLGRMWKNRAIDNEFNTFLYQHYWPFRTIANDLEVKFMELGNSTLRPRSDYNEVSFGLDRARNEGRPFVERLDRNFKQIDTDKIRRGLVWRLLDVPNRINRNFLARTPAFNFKSKELEAVNDLEQLMIDMHGGSTTELEDLLSFVNITQRNQLSGISAPYPSAPFNSIEHFSGMARERSLDFRIPNARNIIERYVQTYTFSKNVSPAWEKAKDTWKQVASVQDANGARPLIAPAKMMLDWLDYLKNGADPGVDATLTFAHSVLNRITPMSRQQAAKVISGGTGMMYRGFLGGQVYPIIRDSMQMFYAVPRVGIEPMGRALRLFTMERGPGAEAMIDEMNRYEVLTEGLPPLEDVPTDPFVAGEGPVDKAALIPREFFEMVTGKLRDAMPPALRGVAGTKLDPLFLYTKTGSMTRLVSGTAAYMKFTDILETFTTRNRLATQGNGAFMSPDEFAKTLGTKSYGPAIEREIKEAINSGNFDKARRTYVREVVAESQHRFGGAEAAPGSRSTGWALGRTLNSFNINFTAFMRNAWKYGDFQEKAKLVLWLGTISGGLTYAAKETGWRNLTRFIPWNPLGMKAGPGIVAAVNTAERLSAEAKKVSGGSLSPEETISTNRSLTGDFLGETANTLNPLKGISTTINNLAEVPQSPDPEEAFARFMLTGDQRYSAADYQQAFNQDRFDPVYELMKEGANLQDPATGNMIQALQNAPPESRAQVLDSVVSVLRAQRSRASGSRGGGAM